MQAIQLRYISATNRKPHRIKVFCERGSRTFCAEHNMNRDDDFRRACVKILLGTFIEEDEKEYGPSAGNQWAKPFTIARLPNQGDYVAVMHDRRAENA